MASFYGTGWSFPPAFDNVPGEVATVSDLVDIQESLQILLGTRPGERIMQPAYGCNLDQLLFEPLTTTFKTYMQHVIESAILYHESRIKVDSVALTESSDVEGLVLIRIDYTVRANNSRFNFVYPYYKNEKSG
ncbi:GPW/gp25 family protein [Chitinophaga sp. sic0106]|uniref:GPW/gp25 family protein n=1 Tax=Chitinophaga sp. sic0106 TaxID=2854785 RepID=UPI001C43F6F9|nr:GPW/gp25 family protein [Chitinophaga sp. sic0106]MBV7530226.1 GPW/gp25 family protein [Chitinophaga sp. sic0106]